MLFNKRHGQHLISSPVKRIIEELKEVYGVKYYYTKSGGGEGNKKIKRIVYSNIQTTCGDKIFITDFKSGYSVAPNFIAEYNHLNGVTYLYSVTYRNLVKLKDGKVIEIKYYPYIDTNKDFRDYILDDAV
jgi:hypothetical protein